MKYYVIDNKGNVWGEAFTKAQAEQSMAECLAGLVDTGMDPTDVGMMDMHVIDEVEAMLVELKFAERG